MLQVLISSLSFAPHYLCFSAIPNFLPLYSSLFFTLGFAQQQKEHLLDCVAHFTTFLQAAAFAPLRPHSVFDDPVFASSARAYQQRRQSSEHDIDVVSICARSRARLMWQFARAACVQARQRSHLSLVTSPYLLAESIRLRKSYMSLFERFLTQPENMRSWEIVHLRKMENEIPRANLQVYRCKVMEVCKCFFFFFFFFNSSSAS